MCYCEDDVFLLHVALHWFRLKEMSLKLIEKDFRPGYYLFFYGILFYSLVNSNNNDTTLCFSIK